MQEFDIEEPPPLPRRCPCTHVNLSAPATKVGILVALLFLLILTFELVDANTVIIPVIATVLQVDCTPIDSHTGIPWSQEVLLEYEINSKIYSSSCMILTESNCSIFVESAKETCCTRRKGDVLQIYVLFVSSTANVTSSEPRKTCFKESSCKLVNGTIWFLLVIPLILWATTLALR